MFKNIELYVNSSKKKALETFSVVKNKLLSLGFNIVNGTNISPDIVIGFGGDGTLLRWLNKNNFSTNSKYIGINCGTLGFLQDVNLNEILNFHETQNNFKEEKLFFIDIEIMQNEKVFKFHALNEFNIEPEGCLRTKVKVDGYLLEHFTGTALLFSSPTGSTARNLSAGGCILGPNLEVFQMTPREATVNSQMRSLPKSICFTKDQIVSLYPNDESEITIKADGYPVFIGNYSKISVTYSNKYLTKLTDSKYNFVTKVREKLIE